MKQIKNRKSFLKATLAISSLLLAGCMGSTSDNSNSFYDDGYIYEENPYESVVAEEQKQQDVVVIHDYEKQTKKAPCPASKSGYRNSGIASSSPAEPDVIPVKTRCQVCDDAQAAEKEAKAELARAAEHAVIKEKPATSTAPTSTKTSTASVQVIKEKPVVVEYVSETVVIDETTSAKPKAADAKKVTTKTAGDKTTTTTTTITERKVTAPAPAPETKVRETKVVQEEIVVPASREVKTTVVTEENGNQKALEDVRRKIQAEQEEMERLRERTEKLNQEKEELERLEAERLEAERLEAERLEAERLEAERKELARLEAEKEELARQELEKQEAERLEAEKQAAAQAQAESGNDSAANSDEARDWVASEGSTLRTLLMEWGDKVGWRVVWNMDRDYTLEAGAVFRGPFVDVAAALLRSFARATPAPKGVFYKGNRVLVVSSREDENAD